MQISPIKHNNTNFKATFKKTKALETLLNNSSHSTLGRFNEVLERATQVRDKKVFKITTLTESILNSFGKSTIFYFHLLSHPENNERLITMERVNSFTYREFSDKAVIFDHYSAIMDDFVKILEKEYPKTIFGKSTAELKEEINKKLV